MARCLKILLARDLANNLLAVNTVSYFDPAHSQSVLSNLHGSLVILRSKN
jgi:hypothetical protein